MGHAAGLVLAERWMVHKTGLQPHWRRWQEIQCQVQPRGML